MVPNLRNKERRGDDPTPLSQTPAEEE